MIRFHNHPIRPFSLKTFLIKINEDIDLISEKITPAYWDHLLDFHKLVLLLEDRRFFRHRGVDIISLVRDVWLAFTFRRHGGFSTIEMQLVRTVTERYDRTVKRKIYEILLAIICNFHFKKFDMLNSYISMAYYGTKYPVNFHPAYSSNFESVANNQFKKSISQLTLEDSAEIASYLVYPRPTVPTERWLKNVERRRNYALKLMAKYKNLFEQIPI
jgi:membrane carboxypeptidase/penicillin-binding protein